MGRQVTCRGWRPIPIRSTSPAARCSSPAAPRASAGASPSASSSRRHRRGHAPAGRRAVPARGGSSSPPTCATEQAAFDDGRCRGRRQRAARRARQQRRRLTAADTGHRRRPGSPSRSCSSTCSPRLLQPAGQPSMQAAGRRRVDRQHRQRQRVRPSPDTAAYGAAKAGSEQLRQTLAVEWAPKVRVNAVTAGLVRTEQAHLFYGDEDGIAARRRHRAARAHGRARRHRRRVPVPRLAARQLRQRRQRRRSTAAASPRVPGAAGVD